MGIAEILKDHRESVIKDPLEFGEQVVVVRRNHVFQDCMRWFKRPDFDVEKTLKVKFVNEEGSDFRGPRRECLQKIVTGLTQCGIFQGEAGYLLPSPNLAKWCLLLSDMVVLLHACSITLLWTISAARQLQ